MFIAGHEVHFHRALLCSYDCKTDTYHKKTVLRVSSSVRSQMLKVDRIRLSRDPQVAVAGEARDAGPDVNTPEGSRISLANASPTPGQQK
jgi:hypothetical protein